MLGVSAVALVAAVVLAEGLDADLTSHVELVGDGGGTDVEPVIVIGGQLSGARGLDMAGPLK